MQLSFRIVVAGLIAIGLYGIFSNRLTFGGDPEIHLIFAKNLLDGHPLQFNAGEYSSGETSPLYMLVLAGVMACVGLFGTAIVMKALGVASALALVFLLRRELRRILGESSLVAEILPWWLFAMPAFAFQAQLGMENMPFALLLAWLQVESSRPTSRLRHVMLTFASVLLFFLRPECVFLMLFRLVEAWRAKDWAWRTAVVVSGGACCLGLVWLIERVTGVPLYAAGMARALISQFDAPPWAVVSVRHFTLRPLSYVAYAWPMLIMVAQRWRRVPLEDREALVCMVLLPIGLHFLNVFPNVHFSRYTLYFWFPAIHAFAASLSTGRSRLGAGAIIMAANTLLVGSAEHWQRWRLQVSSNAKLLQTWQASRPGAVERNSERFCEMFQCKERPVVIAVREVQLRLRLDQRFVIRSLDGIVDNRLLPYIHHDGIDHLGYLAERKVDVVLDWEGLYGRPPQQLSVIAKQAAIAPVRIGHDEFRMLSGKGKHPTRAMLRRSLALEAKQ